jgi:L-ascorbate metabolism protein UlaG (beta-lactamase superfamily)
MLKGIISVLVLQLIFLSGMAQPSYEREIIETSKGPLVITLIGHGTLQMEWNERVLQIDPWSKHAAYGSMPRADIVLITHEHVDHLDKAAIEATRTERTAIIANQAVIKLLGEGDSMRNGEHREVYGIGIDAVPAYNYTEGHRNFHPKGRDNGYVLTFGDKRIYVAGDTEDIPEMDLIRDIELAFLPVNQPYTMTPEQLANAVNKINPRIIIPYHTGTTDMEKVKEVVKPGPGTELRLRSMH